ncbi:MAG: ATP-binding protein [Chloroflexota bacterium]|nr:ATP-binding protein [Chloroflexota bacterium]
MTDSKSHVHLDDPKATFERGNVGELLTYREGQCFDIKRRKDAQEIAQWLVGFANANLRGGLLVLGVGDNGEVVGLRVAYKDGDYRNKIPECRNHVSHVIPQFRFVSVSNSKGEEDELCLIYVPYSSQQVATTSDGEVFLRVGDNTIRLKHEDVSQLKQERGQDIPFCNLPSLQSVSTAQFHNGVLNDYLQRTGYQKQGSDLSRLLLNRQLAVENAGEIRLTKAGLLLLVQDPRYEIPGASLRVIKFEGREKLYGVQNNVIQDQFFFGPIPVIAQRVQEYIRSQLRQFRYLASDNRFATVPELPEEAWFEVIVNALVHRSYNLVSDSITVHIFDDRLEVISPGDYLTGVDPKLFATSLVSRPRNRSIMDFMREIAYVQMQHEGTQRIFGEMQKAGLPPPEYSPPGQALVRVVLRNDIDRRKVSQIGTETSAPTFNMFRLEFQAITSPNDENPANPPTFNELKRGIEQALTSGGWAVSSFTHDVAMDLSKPSLPISSGGEWVSMHNAFQFRLQEFSNKYYLALDFKIEVRSRANLQRIVSVAPQLVKQRFGRGFARTNGKWVAGYIRRVDTTNETATFEIRTEKKNDPKTKLVVPFIDVIPDLTSTQLSELLATSGSRVDLHRERTRFSNLPSTIRLDRIREISAELSRRAFPLTIRGYQVFLRQEPTRALQPDFAVNSFLREPAISFGDRKLSHDISKGLTSFGAYEKPDTDIPIVLMATQQQMPLLERLVVSLQHGSKRYKGFKNTFGANLKVIAKYAVPFEQYKATCEEIVPDLPRSPLPLMLIYMPDERGLWSRSNHQSPYYQVKHYLLENGIPSQGVDQDTLENLDWKDLNLSLDIFAKTGHVPWVLDEGLPLADIFIGLAYSSIRIHDSLERVVAYVCVFDEFGRWQYYIGNTEPVPFEQRDIRLAGLIANAVQRYAENSAVSHVHLHHGHRIKHETRQQIADAVKNVAPNSNVHFLYLNDDNPIRLFGNDDDQEAQIPRGTFIRIANQRQFFLATTGRTDLQSNSRSTPVIAQCTPYYYGLGVNPDPTVYAQHVLSLTRLNWASTRPFAAEPITLLYSSKVARHMNIFVQNYGSFSLHPDLIRTPWFL